VAAKIHGEIQWVAEIVGFMRAVLVSESFTSRDDLDYRGLNRLWKPSDFCASRSVGKFYGHPEQPAYLVDCKKNRLSARNLLLFCRSCPVLRGCRYPADRSGVKGGLKMVKASGMREYRLNPVNPADICRMSGDTPSRVQLAA
jgi:hypothetical protein